MALAHKPPTGLPGSMAIHLSAFKRKRIEQWCEEVAHYLRSGSLCRSVIGHVIEDNRALVPGNATPITENKSAPPGISSRTTSIGTMTDALASKNDIGFKVTMIECTAPPSGRGTPMPDASGPLPVVKFSYSHYNEQRRKIDRLVQGLPVLSSPISASTPGGGDRLNHNGAVVYIKGEEPLKPGAGFGSAGSGRDRERVGRTSAHASPVPASRSSSGEPRLRNSVPPPSSGHVRHSSHSPGPAGRNHTHNSSVSLGVKNHHTNLSHPHNHSNGIKKHPTQTHGLALNHANGRVSGSSEIVVIEDSNHNGQGKDFPSTGFRAGHLPSGNFAVTKSPNVHKTRQRIMANARKSTSQDNHSSSQLPV